MAKITYTDKTIGSKWKAIDANEVKESVNDLYDEVSSLDTELDNKVDKVVGKQLSTEDFTSDEKTKLESEVLTNAYNKKIVVFGSSVAAGVGASTYANSWVGRMTTALTGNWTVVNVAIPGSTTGEWINNFTSLVLPENPDLVIIALSLGNENIQGSSNKDLVYRTFVTNIYTLVDMCRKAGFKVIVTGTYPRDEYSATDYKYIKNSDAELEASNIPFINFLGATDNGAGHWRTGMVNGDGLHPNDIGYDALFRAIPISIFDRTINSSQVSTVFKQGGGFLNFNNTASVVKPIYMTPTTMGSFTIGFWVKQNTGAGTSKALLSIESAATVINPTLLPRVRNVGGIISLTSGVTDLILSTIDTNDLKWHYVLVRFDFFTNTIKLDVDGVNIGSATSSDFSGVTSMTIGGRYDVGTSNADLYSYKGLFVSRVALNNFQAEQIYNGQAFKGSTEVYTSFEETGEVFYPNKANSNVTIKNNLPAATYDTGVTTENIQVNGESLANSFKLSSLNTAPASATATGRTGEIRWDANFMYVCTATNTWKRSALATW